MTEIPSSHRPWLFDDYQARLEELASRGGDRDREVESALAVLTPRELDVVYYLYYDQVTLACAARLMGVSYKVAGKYSASALRKLSLTLEPRLNPLAGQAAVDLVMSLV